MNVFSSQHNGQHTFSRCEYDMVSMQVPYLALWWTSGVFCGRRGHP